MLLPLKYKKRYIAKRYKRFSVLLSLALTIFLLSISGISYHFLSVYLKKMTSVPIKLEKELNFVPLEISGWQGKDVPISLEILKVAQNDDYINRQYSKPDEGLYCNLYISFSSRPRTMLGHRPRVCYKGAGWIHDETLKISLKTLSGRGFPVLLHKFHKEYDEIFVVNYYILNGKISTSEGGFTGLAFRAPNIDGQIARYVAQVQLAGRYESSVTTAAQDFTDTIMEFFPVIE